MEEVNSKDKGTIMGKKKKNLHIIGILFCAIFVILIGTYAWSKSNEDNDQYFNREKVVICLDENNAWNEKHQAKRDIILEDCVSWNVDFNEVNSTLLYITEDGVIVEENVVSGEIIANDMAFLKQYDIGQPIKNVGYTVSGKEITFVHNGSIYVYEKEKGTVEKIVDCTKGEFSRYNVYQWLDENNILFTKEGEIDSELYSFNSDDAEQKFICAVRSYILSPDKTKVYAIKYHSKPNAIGFELTKNIVEINLANGEERVLVEKLETNNYFMKCVDNKYLYYVVGSSEEKWNRLYCLNLENGKKKCVYKTEKHIVGIL